MPLTPLLSRLQVHRYEERIFGGSQAVLHLSLLRRTPQRLHLVPHEEPVLYYVDFTLYISNRHITYCFFSQILMK